MLLESPTGTGKTLCLLCSVLGWLETHRAQQDYMVRQSSANTEEMNRLEEQLRAGAGNDMPAGEFALHLSCDILLCVYFLTIQHDTHAYLRLSLGEHCPSWHIKKCLY